uniref:Plus3 domain-containing protein n=1 Tax=Caenorhabditis tropicalis TaxID=1561998 RepID=A0A1I7U1R3_9PELO
MYFFNIDSSDKKRTTSAVVSMDSYFKSNAEKTLTSRKRKFSESSGSREIEKTNATKTTLSFDAVFGSRSGLSSSSSSSSRESSAEPAEPKPKRGKTMKKEVESVSDLRKARLSRHKLSLLVHAPFFDSTVIGCFVRIGQGMMSGPESKYRIWKIIGVEETNKVYDLEGKRTNKSIK